MAPDIQPRAAPELRMLAEHESVSLCETLDRVLNKGVVVAGELTISVAGIDLIYLGLQLVLTSMETARENIAGVHGATRLSLEIGRDRVNGPQ